MEGTKDFLNQVRKNATKERELLEKSVSAFTSYFRAYKEHKLGYIFRLKDLKLPNVARSYALLRLPKMPEMSMFDSSGFEETQVDFQKIPYKEKRREKQRQEKLKRQREEREAKQKEKEDTMDVNDDDASGSDDEEEFDSSDDSDMGTGAGDEDDDDDDDDFAKEERLMKKLKKGKITQEEMEAELGETTLEQDIEVAYNKAQEKKRQKKAKHDSRKKNKKEAAEPKLFDKQTKSKKRRAAFQAQEKAIKKRKYFN